MGKIKYTDSQIRTQMTKALDHAYAPKRPKANRALTGKARQPHLGAIMGSDVDGGSAPKRNK